MAVGNGSLDPFDFRWWARPDGWHAWRANDTIYKEKDFGELARSLMSSCDIEKVHFIALCDALYFSYLAYEATTKELEISACPVLRIQDIGAKGDSTRAKGHSSPKRIADRAYKHAASAAQWVEELPLELLSHIEREFHNATGGKLRGPSTIHELGGREVELPGEAFASIQKILDALVIALANTRRSARQRSGLKGEEHLAKRACMLNLYNFWTGTLGRPFSVKFESDWGEEEPKNDASLFCVMALRGLIDVKLRGNTCNYLMTDVIDRSRATRAPNSEVSTTRARHSREKSSTIASTRKRRPSSITSVTKSSDHR